MTRSTLTRLALTCALGSAGAAHGGSHLWQINEVFSSADGTVQFVEMRECCGANNETGLFSKWVQSASTGMQFVFPSNIDCCTANKHLLLATAAFAALPGAPTPDHIIPENFIDLDHDTITYWLYPAGTLVYTSGQLPLDGVNSFNRDEGTAINSPTNFAGDEGSVVVGDSCPGDFDDSGAVDFGDLLTLLAAWGPCGDPCDQDIDGSGAVDFADLLTVLAAWGPC